MWGGNRKKKSDERRGFLLFTFNARCSCSRPTSLGFTLRLKVEPVVLGLYCQRVPPFTSACVCVFFLLVCGFYYINIYTHILLIVFCFAIFCNESAPESRRDLRRNCAFFLLVNFFSIRKDDLSLLCVDSVLIRIEWTQHPQHGYFIFPLEILIKFSFGYA